MTAFNVDSCHSIVSYLSTLSQLELKPVTKYASQNPSTNEIQSILTQQLQKDIPLFLERYGSSLTKSLLQLFIPYADDYEVAHHLRSFGVTLPTTTSSSSSSSSTSTSHHTALFAYHSAMHSNMDIDIDLENEYAAIRDGEREAYRKEPMNEIQAPPRPSISSLIRNRRFVALQQLTSTDYFSESKMEEREPALFHQFLGKYRVGRNVNDPNPTTSISPPASTLSSRLQQHAAAGLVPVEPTPTTTPSTSDIAHIPLHHKLSTIILNKYDAHISRDEEQHEINEMSAKQGWRGRMIAQEGEDEDEDEENIQPPPQQQHDDSDEDLSEHDSEPEVETDGTACPALEPDPITSYTWISAETRDEHVAELVAIMQQRFLDGKDTSFDYTSVDGNVQYDDMKQLTRDAEEEYFR